MDSAGATLVIADSAPILGDCNIGDSIAVNGACLTVVEFDRQEQGGWFKVWLANETLDRTDLGECSLPLRRLGADSGPGNLKVEDGVNCERAMGAHVRFGGHFVQARLRYGPSVERH